MLQCPATLKPLSSSSSNHFFASFQNVNNWTVAVAAPAKSKSKCCNCCHDGVQTIDKDKAKALLVETFCVPFLTIDLNSSSTCCEMTLSCADRSVRFVNPSPND